jgi:hypothetical protein
VGWFLGVARILSAGTGPSAVCVGGGPPTHYSLNRLVTRQVDDVFGVVMRIRAGNQWAIENLRFTDPGIIESSAAGFPVDERSEVVKISGPDKPILGWVEDPKVGLRRLGQLLGKVGEFRRVGRNPPGFGNAPDRIRTCELRLLCTGGSARSTDCHFHLPGGASPGCDCSVHPAGPAGVEVGSRKQDPAPPIPECGERTILSRTTRQPCSASQRITQPVVFEDGVY